MLNLLTGKYNFRNYYNHGVLDTAGLTFGNLMQSAGYRTAAFGKWQVNDRDISLKKFRFDDYCIWGVFDPIKPDSDKERGSRYKTPLLYSHGNFIDTNLTRGLYGPDIL
jgi:arylsulfatase A-like enzyme